tara:strand:+ start:147 stop:425 length:279 start_codon:yes stop_codon:yes gene_type:complete
MKQQGAETVALNVLNFLADDEERLQRFMTLSGMEPQTLKDNASDPVFLAGILDYLLQDETLVYMFADAYNTTPDLPAAARRALNGGDHGEYH